MTIFHSRVNAALATLVLGLVASLVAAPATAVTKTHGTYQNMGGNCHAANGWEEAKMARTALGYRNILGGPSSVAPNRKQGRNAKTTKNGVGFSSWNAIVVCNFAGDPYAIYNNGFVRAVQLFARNTTDTDTQMACTISAGYATSSLIFTSTKTVTLTNNGQQNSIIWRTSDNGGHYLPLPANIVCSVPPGVELNDGAVAYDIDVGN